MDIEPIIVIPATYTTGVATRDHAAEFLDTFVALRPGAFIPTKDLYLAYRRWCEGRALEPEGRNTFLAYIWGPRHRSNGVYMIMGIGWI